MTDLDQASGNILSWNLLNYVIITCGKLLRYGIVFCATDTSVDICNFSRWS